VCLTEITLNYDCAKTTLEHWLTSIRERST